MTIYTDVFGGANIYPSEISYSALSLTADKTLTWPDETNTGETPVTKIIDVTSTAIFSIIMPDATRAGTGETVLFNNTGSFNVIVRRADNVQIAVVTPGTQWQIYLSSNATVAGTWKAFQYGVGVSNIIASSLAGTGIVATGTQLSQSSPVTSFSINYTAGDTDRAKLYNWTGASGTLTLPDPSVVGNNWFMNFRNSGSGAVTVTPGGVATIDGAATKSYQPGESSQIVSDGTNFITIGYGKAATFAFDYVVIAVGGAVGNYTLTGTELNRTSYKFTGVLTGNRNIIVPDTIQQYWVDNQTTGAFTLTIKTAAGTGVTVTQGARAITYCEGTNVVAADTSSVAVPINITNGGTGSSTAGGALINLGGGATGITLFGATTTATAWSALGIAPSGIIDGGTF
jgi:hypothetical protein